MTMFTTLGRHFYFLMTWPNVRNILCYVGVYRIYNIENIELFIASIFTLFCRRIINNIKHTKYIQKPNLDKFLEIM